MGYASTSGIKTLQRKYDPENDAHFITWGESVLADAISDLVKEMARLKQRITDLEATGEGRIEMGDRLIERLQRADREAKTTKLFDERLQAGAELTYYREFVELVGEFVSERNPDTEAWQDRLDKAIDVFRLPPFTQPDGSKEDAS